MSQNTVRGGMSGKRPTRRGNNEKLVWIDPYAKRVKGSKLPPVAIQPAPSHETNSSDDSSDAEEAEVVQEESETNKKTESETKQAEEVADVPAVPENDALPQPPIDEDATIADTIPPTPTIIVPKKKTKGWRKKLPGVTEEAEEKAEEKADEKADEKAPSPPPPPPPEESTSPSLPAAAAAASAVDEEDAEEGSDGSSSLSQTEGGQIRRRAKEKKKRRPRVDSQSISKHGKLTGICLVSADYQHLPVATYTVSTKCQLHSYLMGAQITGHLTVCETCNVALCARCYKPFHVEKKLYDYVGEIDKLHAKYHPKSQK